jgi:hypothetical protein
MKYYFVKVAFKYEDEKGKIKSQSVTYLTHDESCMSAEARTVKFLTDNGEKAFEVKSIIESPISTVIDEED